MEYKTPPLTPHISLGTSHIHFRALFLGFKLKLPLYSGDIYVDQLDSPHFVTIIDGIETLD